MVINSLNCNWPETIVIFINGQSAAGNIAESVFSIDCYIGNDALLYKVISTVLMPILALMITVLVWLIYYYFNRTEFLK